MKQASKIFLFFVILSITNLVFSKDKEHLLKSTSLENMINISNESYVNLDLRYTTVNNFLNRDVYGDFDKCYLHPIAAEMLKQASLHLKKVKPGWKFKIFDCLRPRSVQREMWKVVKNTPMQSYVANPEKGSIHNYGFAIDLSLSDEKNNEVDMGTVFDFFGPLAQPAKEAEFLKLGQLQQKQIDNRKALRQAMESAGFIQLPIEWWHFDAKPGKEVRQNYNIIE